jgi:hypothetical protein
MDRAPWRRIAVHGYIALVFALTFVFFPATTIYFANTYDFGVPLGRMASPTLGLVGILAAAVALLLSLVPSRHRDKGTSLAASVTVLVWLQSNLLVRDYGLLDGKAVDWGRHFVGGIVELGIWTAVVVASLVFARAVASNAGWIATGVLVVQSLSFSHAAWTTPEPPSFHRYSVSSEAQFDFSADKNVVILVLDAYQADVFQVIVNDHPEYLEHLDGFVFYRNALAGYAKTYASVPLFLTGQWYENQEPLQEFLRRAFVGASLPRDLMRNGWDVRLYPNVPRTLYFREDIAHNFELSVDHDKKVEQLGQFLDVGILRALPHFGKKWWLNDYNWRITALLARMWQPPGGNPATQRETRKPIHRDLLFLQNLQQRASQSASVPVFRYYHLNVPHAPFMLNEKLELESMRSLDGYYRQSIAALEIARRVVETIKRLGIYDETMLVVLSDHGGGEYGAEINYDALPLDLGSPSLNPQVPSRDHQSALALILVKAFDARGPLRVTDAPVSLGDIPATIAAAAGLPQRYGGRSLFEIREAEERRRRYLFYRFEGWKRNYLPDMTEYLVEGHSWLAQSWNPTGRVLVGGGDDGDVDEAGMLIPLRAGDTVTFGEDGNGDAYVAAGWSGGERAGRWTAGKEALVFVPLAEPISDGLTMAFDLRPFIVHGKIDKQRVHVYVNDARVDYWEVSSPGRYIVHLDGTRFPGSSELTLRFELPDASSPSEHLVGQDERHLGLYLSRLTIDPALDYVLGEELECGASGRCAEHTTYGWGGPETTFTWSTSSTSEMRFRVEPQVLVDLEAVAIRIEAHPFTAKGALPGQEVNIVVNGHAAGTLFLTAAGSSEVVMPADWIRDGKIRLNFKMPGAARPADFYESPDRRRLGIGLKRIVIEARRGTDGA